MEQEIKSIISFMLKSQSRKPSITLEQRVQVDNRKWKIVARGVWYRKFFIGKERQSFTISIDEQ